MPHFVSEQTGGVDRAADASDPWIRAGTCAFPAFAIAVYFGVHFGLNSVAGGDELPPTDNMATVNQAVILLGCLVLVVRHRKAWVAGVVDVWPFLVFMSLAAASASWSQEPEASLRRSITLATLITFATYCHAVLGTLLICRIQVAVMWIVTLSSFAVAVLVPSSGFDIADYAGAVRGIFTQKNTLGDAMVVGLSALGYLVLQRGTVLGKDLACVGLALVTCVLAQATTSFLLCGLIIGATATVLLLLDRGPVASFILLSGFLAACTWIGLLLTAQIDLFALVGKDSTLTGRTPIWAAVNDAMVGHEMLGYGYSAFWLPTAHSSNDVWAALGWFTPSAHSGYLETRLELGIVGLVVLSGLVLVTVMMAVAAALAGSPAPAACAAILLVVIAILNYDESSLPRPDVHLLQWVIAFAACSRACRSRRHPAKAPLPLAASSFR